MTDVDELIVTKIGNHLGSFCVLNRPENTVDAVQHSAAIVDAELGLTGVQLARAEVRGIHHIFGTTMRCATRLQQGAPRATDLAGFNATYWGVAVPLMRSCDPDTCHLIPTL
jgi:hypothetical protein